MLYALLLTASLSILSSFANAEPLSIFLPQLPAPVLPSYSESLNLSPAFHVFQNDDELEEFYSKRYADGRFVTNLCIPSTVANLLLFQVSQKQNRMSKLQIPGMETGSQTVNGADVVKGLIKQCGLEPQTKVNPNGNIGWFVSSGAKVVECLSDIYRSSGYLNTKIRYIRSKFRNMSHPILVGRNPTLQDIRDALKEGHEVIGVFSYQKKDPVTGLWSEAGSHAVNFFGYSANPESTSDQLAIYLQNSNRMYSMDFKNPVFDTALLTQNAEASPIPSASSAIEISTLQGRLINFEGQRTFLAGLIIVESN